MTQAFNNFINSPKNNKRINTIAERLSAYKIDSISIGLENAIKRVVDWLANFDNAGVGSKQLEKILYMLEKMDFMKSSEIAEKLAKKSEFLLKDDKTYIAPLGEESESSFRISASFNQHPRYYSSLEDLLNAMPEDINNRIVLFDDFLNSGGQIVTIFKSLLDLKFSDGETNDEGDKRLKLNKQQKQKLLNAELHLFFYKAFDQGTEYIDIKNENELKLRIKINRYTSADSTDGLFGDKEDRAAIENKISRTISHGLFKGEDASQLSQTYKILKDVGLELLRTNESGWSIDKIAKRSLGYGNEARILITDFNVPTNTITCLWMSGKIFVRGKNIEWVALLPRRKKVIAEKRNTSETILAKDNPKPQEYFIPGYDYLADFNKYTEQLFLKKGLIYDFNNSALLKAYNRLFNEIGEISDFENAKEHQDDIFKNLLNLCSTQDHATPIMVSGHPGSGRTMFMSVLYKYLLDNFRLGNFDKIPVYINLDYFTKIVYKDSDPNFQERAENEISSLAYKTRNILKQYPHNKLLLLIDGIDEYNNPKVNVVNKLSDYIINFNVQSIAGIRKSKDDNGFKNRIRVPLRFLAYPQFKLEISATTIKNDNYSAIIENFALIRAKGNNKEAQEIAAYLKNKIAEYKIEKFDLLILEVLANSYSNKYNYTQAKNLSTHFNIYFSVSKIDVGKAGSLAHKIFNYQESPNLSDKNCLEWWYIHKHDTFKDYFIAKHVIGELLQYNANDNKTFNFVYPNEHNIFFKEIINHSRDSQKRAFENIKKIIPLLGQKEHTSAKTHLCYLLGRFQDDNIKEDARQYLYALKDQLFEQIKQRINFGSNQKLNRDQKKDLLLHRTILISLIFIGDGETSNAYIEQLRENKYFCNLNRGFHLEYYGDIKFDASEDSLKHEDNYGNYCNTFNILYHRVLNGVKHKSKYPMFEIELYTLISLAQHRQVCGNEIIDEEDKRLKIIKLLDILHESVINISQPLFEYLEFIKEILERKEKVTEAHLIAEVFQIKKVKRIGWVKSMVAEPESVADHIYGTYLLANYYLPEKMDDVPGYDKEIILKMLLHHDLPEWYKGDIDGSIKTEIDNMEEETVARKMSLMGTYHNIANVSNTKQLYHDFTHSDHINCRIARDIDKLEMLQQLAIYSKEGSLSKISDTEFRKLKNYSTNVKTDIGRKIREKILFLFE